MADDGDLHKLHGLLEAMLGEQVHLGQSLDRHLQNVQGGRLEENGHLSEDEKMQSILRHLQGVETEGSKLKHDLQILTASQHGHNLTEAYDEQLERLKEDVSRMAHTQQETETHLTELGHVLSACLAGLEQRSPVPSGPAVGPREEAELAAEVEAAHKALQEERDRNAELTQTIASLQQAAEEGKQTKSTLEKALADGADEAKRAITARLKLQAELDEAERSLKKERKLATKAKKRHDEENKKNMATFKELRKEQFGQLAALEGQIEGLQQELAGEKARSQGVQDQVDEARLAYEQKEREIQEMLRIAREEASAQESTLARANTRESEMKTRLAELEAQLARRSEEQEAVSTSAAAAQRSDEDREARLREREEEMRPATEEWERERGERNARVEVLTEQLARANEELAQLKAILAEGEERARLAEERTVVAERTLATATAEWTERQGQAERLYAEQGTALAELGVRLAAFEERLPEIENRAVLRGRDEVQGNLDRLQAEHARLSSQLKQAEKEARAYKAEAEALRNELALASQKPAGAALASHPGVQTRRKLEPEMRAAASSPAAASADHDTRKVRRRSEPDKEQDITDLLQSDDVVQTRPRTMPATTSGQSLSAATGGTSASADHRTDPVEYLSEELVLYMFSRLSARDLLSLARVNRKYRRIASDASLWRPKCLRLWHFQESEGSAYTDTDWKEVYIYRHTHYKQVSCVVVGDENVGKKTLITAFEGMVTQKGWKRGQERERCTVCVESLFGVPTMFHLTVLKANPPDPCSDLMHHLADLLTRTKVDVFLLCVPASGSVEATKSRLDALESKVLPALDALCPDVPRILVGTETDIKEEHYDHSHPTAISMSFSNFVERHHCHAAVLTSAMSNRNLVELFDRAQSLVATPNLRLKVSHDQVVVMNQTIRSKERKPPRSTALGPRASTQYGYPDAVASLPTPLQTSPSSPRRQGGTPARGAASPYVAPATPSPSTPYTPYSASSSLFTPSSSTPADGPPLSPYLYNQPVSQSTPLPSTTGTPLASAASTGTATPGSTTRNWRRLRSSASDTPRSQRDNKCALQ